MLIFSLQSTDTKVECARARVQKHRRRIRREKLICIHGGTLAAHLLNKSSPGSIVKRKKRRLRKEEGQALGWEVWNIRRLFVNLRNGRGRKKKSCANFSTASVAFTFGQFFFLFLNSRQLADAVFIRTVINFFYSNDVIKQQLTGEFCWLFSLSIGI